MGCSAAKVAPGAPGAPAPGAGPDAPKRPLAALRAKAGSVFKRKKADARLAAKPSWEDTQAKPGSPEKSDASSAPTAPTSSSAPAELPAAVQPAVEAAPAPASAGARAAAARGEQVGLVPGPLTAADLEAFLARVPAGVKDGLCAATWDELEEVVAAAQDPEALMRDVQYWWLDAKAGDEARTAAALVVTCVKQGLGGDAGLVLLLGVADEKDFPRALKAVRHAQFGREDIGVLRCTLWLQDVNGSYVLNKDLEAVFKESAYKWFQLTNTKTGRGQVMQTRRGWVEEDPQAEQ